MKKLRILLLIVFVVGMSAKCVFADVLFNAFTEHWYDIVEGDWFQGESTANSLGGHLVAINDAAENEWLRQNFNNGLDAWIGLYQLPNEGEWQWTTGEPVTFTEWWIGEPNDKDGVEHWAYRIGVSNPQYWNDSPWDDRGPARGIAEFASYPQYAVPEPTTMLLFSTGLLGAFLRRRKV